MTISQRNPRLQSRRVVEGRLASHDYTISAKALKRLMTDIRVTQFFRRNRLRVKRLETEAAKNGPPASASARLFPGKLFFRVCPGPMLEMTFFEKNYKLSLNDVFVRRWLMNKYLMCLDRLRLWLEHLKKFCSHPVRPSGSGLFGFWLRFRSVTGRCGHAPSLKPCQKPKILAPHGYRIFLNALDLLCPSLSLGGPWDLCECGHRPHATAPCWRRSNAPRPFPGSGALRFGRETGPTVAAYCYGKAGSGPSLPKRGRKVRGLSQNCADMCACVRICADMCGFWEKLERRLPPSPEATARQARSHYIAKFPFDLRMLPV